MTTESMILISIGIVNAIIALISVLVNWKNTSRQIEAQIELKGSQEENKLYKLKKRSKRYLLEIKILMLIELALIFFPFCLASSITRLEVLNTIISFYLLTRLIDLHKELTMLIKKMNAA